MAARTLILRSFSARHGPVVIGLAGLLGLHVWWLAQFRADGFREYDEAGYLSIALRNTHAFEDGGLPVGLRMAVSENVQAPLVPTLAVPALILADGRTSAAWSVQLLSLVILTLAAAAVARRCCPGRWPLLAAGVVATLPSVTDYARLFHFALPATALLMMATLAVLDSDGLLSRRHAILAGFLLGLMTLTRTMTLGYIPGLGCAALLLAVACRGERRRRLTNWLLIVGTTAATASLWYLPHARSVGAYLLGSGYGSDSAEFGSSQPFSPAALLDTCRVVLGALRLPLAVGLGLAAIVGAAVVVKHVPPWRRAITSNQAVLLLVVAEGILVLVSTPNEGTAFELPFIPHIIVLAVSGLAVAPRVPGRLVGGILAAASLAGLLASSALVPGLRPLIVAVPGAGAIRVLDPRGVIHSEAEPLGDTSHGRKLPSQVQATRAFADEVALTVISRADEHNVALRLIDAAGDPLLNSTRYRLAARELARRELVVRSFHPRDSGDSITAMAAQMRTTAAPFIITGEPRGEAAFGIVQTDVEQAVLQAGYRSFRTLEADDGRLFRLWEFSG